MERRCSATGFTKTLTYNKGTCQKKGPVSKNNSEIAEVLQSEIFPQKQKTQSQSSSHDQKQQIEVKDAHICTKAGQARLVVYLV